MDGILAIRDGTVHLQEAERMRTGVYGWGSGAVDTGAGEKQ